ncbi:MAG TPA: tetratricopeptide repeat protein, partial [Pyrinomonadaceae bacterium]|nr:tetratricopeptide repeat protein [Pyrinomonadaceae bacterium]
MRQGVKFAAAVCVILIGSLPAAFQTRPTTGAVRAVTISSEPNTKVWIDGILYGKTDKTGVLEIRSVASGAHTLTVRADGFKQKSQPLAATAKGEVKVALVKTTDEAELAFQEAERLLSRDRDQAIAAYEKAVKLRPNFPEALVALARAQADNLDVEGALKTIQTARRLRPGYAEASAVEGRIYRDNADEAKAIASFKRAITEGKGFQPEALTGLGLLYKEKAEGLGGAGDFENESANYVESAKYLKQALKQLSGAPDSVVIYQLLGLVYERQKKWD